MERIPREQHTAIYARVSSKAQDLRSQLPDLERWATAHDGQVRWYRDKFTGKVMQRDGWSRLEADARAGSVSRIVVWRLDRLGRTASGLTALFDDLRARRINLVSLRDGLDLETPAGRLMAGVLASVAQYETEVRSERQLAGIAAALASGKRWGGSVKGRRLKVTDEQVACAKRMRLEGEKISRIARATGLSRPTVYQIVKEE